MLLSSTLSYNRAILSRNPLMPEQTEPPTQKIYNDPISVAKRTDQRLHYVASHDKARLLAYIINKSDLRQCVVITKTKRDADTLSTYLKEQSIRAAAVHGNRRAQENDAAVKVFKEDGLDILITTDMILLSLGLSDLACIISHDLPTEPKHYLSRLGCLNASGKAIALVDLDEERELFDIERVMRQEIAQEEVEGFSPTSRPDPDSLPKSTKDQKKRPRHRKQRKKKGASEKEDHDMDPKK